MQEPSYIKEARLAQQRFDHNNPVQLEIGELMEDETQHAILVSVVVKARSDSAAEDAVFAVRRSDQWLEHT